MKKITARKQLVTLIVGLVVLAGGIVIVAQILSGSPADISSKQTTSDASKAVVTFSSPEPVVKDLAAQKDKLIAIKGTVVKIERDYYISGGSDPKSQSAIKLDFSQSDLNGDDYVDTPPQNEQEAEKYTPKGNFVVTGKLALKQPKQPLALVVQNIKSAE